MCFLYLVLLPEYPCCFHTQYRPVWRIMDDFDRGTL